MHRRTVFGQARFGLLEVAVEMIERVLFDAPCKSRAADWDPRNPKRARVRFSCPALAPSRTAESRSLVCETAKRLMGSRRKFELTSPPRQRHAGAGRSASRNTCARWSAVSVRPSFRARPSRCMRQPMSAETTMFREIIGEQVLELQVPHPRRDAGKRRRERAAEAATLLFFADLHELEAFDGAEQDERRLGVARPATVARPVERDPARKVPAEARARRARGR